MTEPCQKDCICRACVYPQYKARDKWFAEAGPALQRARILWDELFCLPPVLAWERLAEALKEAEENGCIKIGTEN